MKTGWGGDIYKRTERSKTSIAGRATERASAMVRDRSTYQCFDKIDLTNPIYNFYEINTCIWYA